MTGPVSDLNHFLPIIHTEYVCLYICYFAVNIVLIIRALSHCATGVGEFNNSARDERILLLYWPSSGTVAFDSGVITSSSIFR